MMTDWLRDEETGSRTWKCFPITELLDLLVLFYFVLICFTFTLVSSPPPQRAGEHIRIDEKWKEDDFMDCFISAL